MTEVRKCCDCGEEFIPQDVRAPASDLEITARQIRCVPCTVVKHFG